MSIPMITFIITPVFKPMPTPTVTPTNTSIFTSMTISDWITAVIAVISLFVAIAAFFIPHWKSRTRLDVVDAFLLQCSLDLAILDFVLVNQSSNPVSITGIELVGNTRIPARRYSEKIPSIRCKENNKVIRDSTTAFPITISPYNSIRIIAGFDEAKYAQYIHDHMTEKANQKGNRKIKEKSVADVATICIHTSRKNITITMPYQTGDVG